MEKTLEEVMQEENVKEALNSLIMYWDYLNDPIALNGIDQYESLNKIFMRQSLEYDNHKWLIGILTFKDTLQYLDFRSAIGYEDLEMPIPYPREEL